MSPHAPTTAARTATPASDGTTPLPQLLTTRDSQRLRNYHDALNFYTGKQWPRLTRRTTITRLRLLTINRVRAIVNKTSSYVRKGATVGIDPEHRPEQPAAAAEQALADISESNGLPRLDHASEIDTAVIGDGAYKITWDPAAERVVITSPDMRGIFPWPHPTDPMRFTRIAHRYTLAAAEIIRLWGFRPARDPATIIEDWRDDTLDLWIDQELVDQLINPYGFIPFVIYPNEEIPKQWNGESDVLPLTEIAEEINAQYTRLSNILELSGNPIAILEGVDKVAGIEATPGAIWAVPQGAKADVLDLLKHGGARIHIEYLTELLTALHDVSETPRTAFGGNERELSGIALEIDLQPLLQKVERKRLIRGDAYRTRAGLSLKLLEIFTGTTHLDAGRITVEWDAPTPQDRTREVSDERSQVEAGLSSHRSSMARLNVPDPDAEWDRLHEERQRPDSLNPSA